MIDGETGLLVDPRDPNAIAGAMVRLLRDEDLAHRLGEQARHRALTEMSWDRYRKDLLRELGWLRTDDHRLRSGQPEGRIENS